MGASLAMLFGVPVSSSTILRLACGMEEPMLETPRVLGIDDWAYKKGRNYGTILVDLEKRQPVDFRGCYPAQVTVGQGNNHESVRVVVFVVVGDVDNLDHDVEGNVDQFLARLVLDHIIAFG